MEILIYFHLTDSELDILLESTSPDIIIGTETWTNNTMHSVLPR